MPNDRLYLHEIIHIVGAGSEPYKRHTAARAAAAASAPLVGMWQQSGSTGDWPRVVNLWEMRGWDHWAELLEYQYARAQPGELKTWWTQALAWRSGGFDRILEPAPFSPTRADLIARGPKGLACIQEIATVRPGTADAYLDAVATRWMPAAARRGMTLAGAWRTAMRDTEAVLLWCFPTYRDYTSHLQTYWTDRETVAWAETARTWRTDYRETLLVPSAWSVVHPAWTEAVMRTAATPAKRARPTARAVRRTPPKRRR
jgi:hypothetical protein